MPTELRPDVYDITVREKPNGRRYRVFLIDYEVPTLFDTGYEDSTDRLFKEIESLGIEPERVVLTHADGDHVGGFDAVIDRYGAESYVPESSSLDTAHEPDVRYADGDDVGSLLAVAVPGHARDQHVLVDEERGILIAGDALSGADLRGFPEGYLLPHAAVFSEDSKEAELNLDRLLAYDFDSVLVYHGSSVIGDAYEVLDRYVNFPGRPPEPVK